jgi:hypothetical protein
MVASELSQSAMGATRDLEPADESKNVADEPSDAKMTNRSGASKSSYVRDYADSPVEWQLLDDEAIELAKKQNKMIFLNIGYKSSYCKLGIVWEISD